MRVGPYSCVAAKSLILRRCSLSAALTLAHRKQYAESGDPEKRYSPAGVTAARNEP